MPSKKDLNKPVLEKSNEKPIKGGKKGATKEVPVPEPVPEPIPEKKTEKVESKAKASKKVVVEEKVEVPDNVQKKPAKNTKKTVVEKSEPEVIPEPITTKKPTKTTKKVETPEQKITIEKKEEINIDDIDEEQLKIWKNDWFYIIEKYTELKREQELLEIKRDEVVKKMNDYLMAKKGLVAENIIDSSTKMKKTINKVDMSLNKLEDDNDLDDDDDSDDSDDDDESEEATPAGPLKKGSKIIKFNASKTSGKKEDSSDSD